MGELFNGSRKKADGSVLEWGMALPLAAPLVEVLPFMIDWKDSVHPTASLPNTCQLLELRATHPNLAMVEGTLLELGIDMELKQSEEISLQATLKGPKGIIVLK